MQAEITAKTCVNTYAHTPYIHMLIVIHKNCKILSDSEWRAGWYYIARICHINSCAVKRLSWWLSLSLLDFYLFIAFLPGCFSPEVVKLSLDPQPYSLSRQQQQRLGPPLPLLIVVMLGRCRGSGVLLARCYLIILMAFCKLGGNNSQQLSPTQPREVFSSHYVSASVCTTLVIALRDSTGNPIPWD